MTNRVYELSGFLFMDKESAIKTADRWIASAFPPSAKFEWAADPAVHVREENVIIWRGTYRSDFGLMVIADVKERIVS